MNRLNKENIDSLFKRTKKTAIKAYKNTNLNGKKAFKNMQIRFKKIFSLDFDKPLSFQDQMLIMFVILFISCILFTIVYIFALTDNKNVNISSSDDIDNQTSDVISKVEVPADDTSSTDKKNQQSEVSQTEITNHIFQDRKIIKTAYDDIHNGDLILVNKECECHHDGEDTVSLLDVKSDSYVITDNTVRLNESIIDNVNLMFDDFEELYGANDVMIACGYRSYYTQLQLYNEEIDSVGEEEAEQWVAPPGFSEHQTGLVFDLTLNIDTGAGGIKYDGDGMYSWINKNCYQYGFILRYLQGKENITGYQYEPWHFRYVGKAAAAYIMENHITLEEYIDVVHTYTIDNPLIINGDNDKKWYVYYVKADNYDTNEIVVPNHYNYTISGDNYSGFIITVES